MTRRLSTNGTWARTLRAPAIALAALAFSGWQPSVFAQDAGTAPQETAGQAQLTLDDLRTFTDVFNQARRNYVEEVDDRTLLDSAIRGMLAELDPHSKYLPAQDYEDLNDAAQGRYSGIGVDVRASEGKLVVNAIITDSPADRAGMNPGDVITSIDGRPVKGRYLPDAMDELLGDPETEVVLTVLPPEGEAREVTLVRRYIQIPTMHFELLDSRYGYFRMTAFHKDSAGDLEAALESIRSDGIEMDALVIDLRDNPGGVLQEAVAMADGFLDEGVIVSTRGRNSKMQLMFTAESGQWLPGMPLMLLVDRGTASASEVVAGALQDHGRAVIAGERTFGKGSVQSVLPLRNGGGIKLTTARYYTPSGRSIQAQGIEPDVPIEWELPAEAEDDRPRESDLDRHLELETRDTEGAGGAVSPLQEFPLEEVLAALREAGIVRSG